MTTEYDAPTLDEYNAKFNRNYKINGFYTETHMDFPCPFCAEPDLFTYHPFTFKPIDNEMGKPHKCPKCERTSQVLIKRSPVETRMEVVQLDGDDIPSYLPFIRRIT